MDLLMFDDIKNAEIPHFHTLDLFLFTVSFVIPVDVALSQCIGVGGCR